MLTPAHLQLASNLLELASDSFGNHGCNDYLTDATPENIKIIRAAVLWSSGEDEEPRVYDGKVFVEDYLLMRYLSHLMQRENG